MLAMFNDTKLPTDNERALELLTSINTLWDENSWLDEETHETLHLEVSPRIQEEIVKVVVAYPESVEELLANEICIHSFIEWVIHGEENDEVL